MALGSTQTLRARTHQEPGNRNATAISENCYQPELNTLLNGAAQIEETVTHVSSIYAAPFSNICSTQADNNSRKLRLRSGCQFPSCALALIEMSTRNLPGGGGDGGRSVKLTTLPPSVSRLSTENVGASTSHNPMGLHGLLQGQLCL
jgi:hypothetical protein